MTEQGVEVGRTHDRDALSRACLEDKVNGEKLNEILLEDNGYQVIEKALR